MDPQIQRAAFFPATAALSRFVDMKFDGEVARKYKEGVGMSLAAANHSPPREWGIAATRIFILISQTLSRPL